MAMARSDNFKVKGARLSYAGTLFKPRAQKNSTVEKYGCTLIFDKKDAAVRADLEQRVLKVATEEWGDKAIGMIKAGLIKSPFLAGDGKEARNKKTAELHPGMSADVYFIRAQAGKNRPPFVIWRDSNKQETETAVYSGCYGNAVLNLFTWKNDEGGNGVSFGIAGFQKIAEGEVLGNGGPADPNEWADKIEDAGDAPAETKTGAGAAGLFG